jgi:hypothetical protein
MFPDIDMRYYIRYIIIMNTLDRVFSVRHITAQAAAAAIAIAVPLEKG